MRIGHVAGGVGDDQAHRLVMVLAVRRVHAWGKRTQECCHVSKQCHRHAPPAVQVVAKNLLRFRRPHALPAGAGRRTSDHDAASDRLACRLDLKPRQRGADRACDAGGAGGDDERGTFDGLRKRRVCSQLAHYRQTRTRLQWRGRPDGGMFSRRRSAACRAINCRLRPCQFA